MLEKHRLFGQALRAAGFDVVLLQNVQHTRTHQACDIAHRIERQRQRRHDVMLPALQSQCWQPPELYAEQEKQRRRHHEIWHRNAQVRNQHHNSIGRLVVLKRRQHARRNADQHRQRNRHAADARRNREFLAQNLIDREADSLVAVAQIEPDQALHVHSELLQQRFIQTVFRLHHFHRLRARALGIERSARNHIHQEECDRRDDQQRQHRGKHSLYDKPRHQKSPASR